MILDDVSGLKPNSNKKVECRCDDCGVPFSRSFQVINKQKYPEHYCFGCARKRVGLMMDTRNIVKSNQKRTGNNHPRWNPDKRVFEAYAYKVRRLSEETYRQYRDLINPDSKPRTLCGIDGGFQLDHIIPIKVAFERGLQPEDCATLQNLQIVPWEVNRRKGFGQRQGVV